MNRIVLFMERNIHGAWTIHGALGYRQYYGYSKAEARARYIEEYKRTDGQLVNRSK